MLQSSRSNHKLNSQNGMARTVVTPARAATKETTNVLVLVYLAVVEEGPVTPVLCGGMPLTFGGIH